MAHNGTGGVRGLHHAGLTVPDMDQAIAFFCGALGCSIVLRTGRTPPADAEIARARAIPEGIVTTDIAVLRCGAGFIELFTYEGGDAGRDYPPNQDRGGHHLAFEVADIAAAAVLIEAAGGRLCAAPRISAAPALKGLRWAYFYAPWGLQLEIVEPPRGHVLASPPADALSEREAIADMLIAYCNGLDRMDLDAVVGLFTADCVVDYGADPRLRSEGAARLREDLARLWRWRRTSHHLSNVRISLTSSDQAQATSYVIAWHEAQDGTTATLFGQYADTFVRTPDGWRIAYRRQMMNGADAGFTLPIHPAERFPPPAGWRNPFQTV